MILKISLGGLNTIREVIPLSDSLYRVADTGQIIDTSIEGVVTKEVDILEINNLSEIDAYLGEVLLYAIRYVSNKR